MKKIIFSLVMLLAFFGLMTASYAVDEAPAGDGYSYMGSGGENGITPRTLIVPVRYALRGGGGNPSLASGDVVTWDSVSRDGFTISACTVQNGHGFAGVLVTPIQTADSSIVNRNTRNWGYMAIKGYVLARVDASESTEGNPLRLNGAVLPGSFATSNTTPVSSSQDIGILLLAPGADGLAPVWLR